MSEFYMILARKKYQNTRFLWYFPKNYQNFLILHDFCPKNARILQNNCHKNISPIFGGRGGASALPAPSRLLRLWALSLFSASTWAYLGLADCPLVNSESKSRGKSITHSAKSFARLDWSISREGNFQRRYSPTHCRPLPTSSVQIFP